MSTSKSNRKGRAKTLRIESLDLTLSTAVPTGLQGPPGIGKTAAISAMARPDFPVEVLTLSLCGNGEVGGIMWASQDENGTPFAVRALPDYFRRICDAGQGIIFLDELTTAQPAVRATALRLICNKAIENVKLPNDVFMVCAYNLPEHVSSCYELDPAMANRLRHVPVTPDAARWVNGIVNNWGKPIDPDIITPHRREAQIAIASYIKRNPSKLYNFPQQESERSGPWPSPRSWDNAAMQLGDELSAGLSIDDIDLSLSQIIGRAAALEFATYRKALDLPDVEEMLRDPDHAVKTWKPENRTDIVFCVFGNLISAVTSNTTQERWNAMIRIMCSKNVRHDDVFATFAKQVFNLKDRSWPLPANTLATKMEFLRRAGLDKSK